MGDQRLRNRVLFLLMFLGVFVTSAWAQVEGKSNFPRFNFNVGGGYGVGRGDVGSFVGNSFFAVGGAGMNLNRMFGFNGEYMYYDLGIRPSVSLGQNLQSTSGSLHSFSLNGIVRAPYRFGGLSPYGIFGVGFYDRRVSSNTGKVAPGTPCQPSWTWWDVACYYNPNSGQYDTRTQQTLLSNSKIAGGYNYGGGITYPLHRWHNAKVYAEYRYHKAYQSDVVTIVWPFSVGLRW
jgi:hypothetical protein